MSERGRVQVEWNCSNQTRAITQRDWLNAQLVGRGYIAEDIPRVKLKRGVWTTRCDIAFDTVAEGDTIRTLCLSRQAADSFILTGSYTQFHTCRHEDGIMDCSTAPDLVRTVK